VLIMAKPKLTNKDIPSLEVVRAEIARRKKEEALRYYVPHKKQLDFHMSNKRNRWSLGGNRTGKTVCGAVEAVYMATGTHPYRSVKVPNKGWVVSLTNEVQRDVAQKEVLKWLPKAEIADVHVRSGRKDDPENAILDFIVLKNGSTIAFKSVDQGRPKFQGTSLEWIWFDEEPPKEIYDECKMRIIDTRGDIWGTMTPLQGLTWVYETIYVNENNDPNVKYWLMEWADNPHLSPDEIESLMSTMSEEERESRQYGKFVAMSGLVYKEFVEDIHVIDPIPIPLDWYDNISIDPGLAAPLSCHFYAYDGDGNIYVIAEHYKAGETIEYHSKQIHRIATELGWPRHRGYLDALFDSAANQKTLAAEKSVAELFGEHGIEADTVVDKNKWSGIQRVKQYLKLRPNPQTTVWPKGKPKLFIFRTCTNLIKEIKSYRWKPDGDEPIKKNDHGLDEMRYYIMSKPELKELEIGIAVPKPISANRDPGNMYEGTRHWSEIEDDMDEESQFMKGWDS